MKRETAEWLACMVVASIGLTTCLWVVPYLPTNDGPQHVLSAHIENHFSDPGSIYPTYYSPLPQFAAKGFALVFGPLESVMSWRLALRITLSVVSLAFAWGFALVVRAIDIDDDDTDRDRRVIGLLGFAIALPWALYMGFFPFVIGSTIGLYTLAFVLRERGGGGTTTTKRRALVMLLLLVQAVCHVFTAILTGIIVTVLAMVRAPTGQRLRELLRMTIVGLPAMGVFGLSIWQRELHTSTQQDFSWSFGERLHTFARWFVAGPSVRGWMVVALVLVGIVATLVQKKKKLDEDSSRASAPKRALAWMALACLALSLLGPLHIVGWQYFAPRFVLCAAVLGLALVPMPPPRAWRIVIPPRAVGPLLTAVSLGSSIVSANLHRTLASSCAESLAGLDVPPLHFTGSRLPIVLDEYCGIPEDARESPVPYVAPARNIPALYAVEHGGIAPTLFAGSPSIHAFLRRPEAGGHPPNAGLHELALHRWFRTDPTFRTAILTDLAAEGMSWEGIVLLGGRADDALVFHDRGYVEELRRGSLLIARFEGCPAELLLPKGSLDHESVYYEYGLFNRASLSAEPSTIGMWAVPPNLPTKDDGAIHVPLVGRPCGEIWVRVVWDGDRSLTRTPGDRTCERANKDGRVITAISRDHFSVSCAPKE